MSFYGEALEERLVAGELLVEALMAFDGADDITSMPLIPARRSFDSSFDRLRAGILFALRVAASI